MQKLADENPGEYKEIHDSTVHLSPLRRDTLSPKDLVPCKEAPLYIILSCFVVVKVFLDGVELKLPELEGVVLLNINSWSSGCSVWSESDPLDNFGPARMDDQLLEVMGLYSSLHVGRIQVSMADPIRLGQARQVKVHCHTLHFNDILTCDLLDCIAGKCPRTSGWGAMATRTRLHLNYSPGSGLYAQESQEISPSILSRYLFITIFNAISMNFSTS